MLTFPPCINNSLSFNWENYLWKVPMVSKLTFSFSLIFEEFLHMDLTLLRVDLRVRPILTGQFHHVWGHNRGQMNKISPALFSLNGLHRRIGRINKFTHVEVCNCMFIPRVGSSLCTASLTLFQQSSHILPLCCRIWVFLLLWALLPRLFLSAFLLLPLDIGEREGGVLSVLPHPCHQLQVLPQGSHIVHSQFAHKSQALNHTSTCLFDILHSKPHLQFHSTLLKDHILLTQQHCSLDRQEPGICLNQLHHLEKHLHWLTSHLTITSSFMRWSYEENT